MDWSNERYLSHLKREEDIQLGKRILDLKDKVIKNHEITHTVFLDPHQIRISTAILNNFQSDVSYKIEGAYAEAERKILVIFPEYRDEGDIESDIAVLMLKLKDKNQEVTHQSVLGSLMALGIERDVVGDIVIDQQKAYIILMQNMVDYIRMQLEKIGKSSILIETCDISNLEIPKPKVEAVFKVISSLRLDVVVSAIGNMSRQEASKHIAKDFVKVNWSLVDKNAMEVQVGDMISIRGYGRFYVKELLGTTKKDNYRVLFEKLIG